MIQRCSRSYPKCISKNVFSFSPVLADALLVALLICFPFYTIALSSLRYHHGCICCILSLEQYVCTDDFQISQSTSGVFCPFKTGPFTVSSNISLDNPLTNILPKSKVTLGKNQTNPNPSSCFKWTATVFSRFISQKVVLANSFPQKHHC